MRHSNGAIIREHIRRGDRPLIVSDVDEVVLEFVTPFGAFLESRGHMLLPRSFRLTGNIVSKSDGAEATADSVRQFLQDFFREQVEWQTPAEGASEALADLAQIADIVFLTSMPPDHYPARRKLLDLHGLNYPLLATEEAKGPIISDLHAGRAQPLFFIDDLLPNLLSVREHADHAHILHFMANETFRAMAPHAGDNVSTAQSWTDIRSIIEDKIGACSVT